MTESLLIAGLSFIVLVWIGIKIRHSRRRKCLLSEPFPQKWRDLLVEKSSLYRVLPETLREKLNGLIQIFLDEKNFEGCGGFAINDSVKILIASQACLLLLNRKSSRLCPALSTILVYPTAYVASQPVDIGSNQSVELEEERSGESWSQGSLVLAWDEAQCAFDSDQRGPNVILHEFAHQLDHEDGLSENAPLLNREYERLKRDLSQGKRAFLDEYAATDPAEFFAVATEAFFEEPHAMRKRHPELYQALCGYYGLNPADWTQPKP